MANATNSIQTLTKFHVTAYSRTCTQGNVLSLVRQNVTATVTNKSLGHFLELSLSLTIVHSL